MKTELNRTFDNTARTLAAIDNAFRDAGAAAHNNDWVLLMAITPPILAAFAVTEIGAWAIAELGRQIRIHEKRPASPSLRGTPTAKELADDWADQPRTLETCLRLGSRLADLDPTLDHSLVRKPDAAGRLVIRARKGGMKGWLEDHRVAVGYSTVMRYKKLAQRLRQVLALDDRLPLEWVMSGVPADHSLPSDLAAPCAAASRRLAKLLRENRTLVALTHAVEKALGIVRLVAVRKAPVHRRLHGMKKRKTPAFSVISRGRTATVDDARLEATRMAMGRLMAAKNLAGPARHLRNRIAHWLSGVAAGRGRPAGEG
jgi:hypothetical protein